MTTDAVFRLYKWFFVVFLVLSSALTLLAAHEGAREHAVALVYGLATCEIAAALLLLRPQTRMAASAALVTIFLIAGVLTTGSGGSPLRFILYAGTAVFIAVFDRASGLHPALPSGGRATEA